MYITPKEIVGVVKSLKNKMVLGEDGIPIGVIKNGGRPLIEFLYKMLLRNLKILTLPLEKR